MKKFREFLEESTHVAQAEKDAKTHDGGTTTTKKNWGSHWGGVLAASEHQGRLGKELEKRGYTKIQHHNVNAMPEKPSSRLYHKPHNGKNHYVHIERDGKGNIHAKSYHA